ncbi:MAG: signal peptidase II [Candidatus Omnitrophica bacterium]|nr:signal peptidase II [Candidatus Omnitrophota bacterium]
MSIWVGIIVLFFDQLTKYLVRLSLYQGQSVVLIPHLLYLTYIKNPGISFGLFKGKIPLLFYLVLSLLAIGMLIFFLRRARRNRAQRIATGLITGGILGNLIDRVRFGAVIDFLDFRVWPIFNLADSGITIGIIILLIHEIKNSATS